jgi:hypothetical protein
VGIESTVIDMTGETPMILRPGILTAEKLSAVLGKEVIPDPSLLKKPEISKENRAFLLLKDFFCYSNQGII